METLGHARRRVKLAWPENLPQALVQQSVQTTPPGESARPALATACGPAGGTDWLRA